MKKRVYMFQPNLMYGGSVYFPYASGAIAAYAFSDPEVAKSFALERIFYLREDIDSLVESLEEPSVAAFSSYIWNYEYNKALAAKLKSRFPNCFVHFGGHSVPPDTSLLEECDFIDGVTFGEGEEPFHELLLALVSDGDLGSVSNSAFRRDGRIFQTPRREISGTDYPSPYAYGIFDSMLAESDMDFSTTIETNRGCPYKCAYCDWGVFDAKMRCFPIERVRADIEWMAEHKIDYCYCADANFGLLDRDLEIADMLIESNSRTGFPKKFQVNYTKNSDATVFEINQKLNDCHMSKGATLSFQSLSEKVLENIGRKNMTLERFGKLLKMYNDAGIGTYSEIILGLPGETTESFKNGIDSLLQAGQHTSIIVYNCDSLVNSRMAQPEYVKKFKIETALTPLRQTHCDPLSDGVTEYSEIIVSTSDMNREAWVEMNLFSFCVQCFHSLGLLQLFAIYAFFERGMAYRDFYSALLEWMNTHPASVCGDVFADLRKRLEKISASNGSWYYTDERFGSVTWPFEEGAFLKIVAESERFYSEIYSFLSELIDDKNVLDELLEYQRAMIRLPGKNQITVLSDYDFPGFFAKAYAGEHLPLKKKKCKIVISDTDVPDTWERYGREIVWYGRRGGKYMHSAADIIYT